MTTDTDIDSMTERELHYWEAIMTHLRDSTIIEAGTVLHNGEIWPAFVIRDSNGTEFDCIVARDGELNGAGFLKVDRVDE